MSKWYVVLLSVVLLFSIFIIKHPVSYKPDNQRFISIDSLEQRVFAQYGEGDEGIEEMIYLTTGEHKDFMGNPIEIDTFHMRNGLVLYRGDEFYNFIPLVCVYP